MADVSSSPSDFHSKFLVTSPTLVQDKIENAFDNFEFSESKGFVQFWAPVKTTTGRCLLTTSDQPFAISEHHHSGGKKYRSCSLRYQYSIDHMNKNRHEGEEETTIITNGAPARAFLSLTPQLLPDLRVHQITPLERCAFRCGLLFCSFVLPVFYPSESSCVGVVEFCSCSWYYIFTMLNELAAAFETRCGLQHASDKIQRALGIIWPKFHSDWPKFVLNLAQVWIACEDEDDVADFQEKRMFGLKLVDHHSYHESYDGDLYLYQLFVEYANMCYEIPSKIWEGLIGQTLENHKPRFMKKVSKLSDNQPLMMIHNSDDEGYPFECSCFVICLRSIETGDLDYVFEFLWHEVPNYVMVLESLLLLLKKCLPDFKYASGGELGDELSIIDVADSSESKTEYFKIFEGNRSSLASDVLEKKISAVEDRLTSLEAKCKTSPISLSEEGMIEAANKPYVSLSTLKRKRKDQSEMYLDENIVTIKAEYADDLIKFHLPISSTTFGAIVKEVSEGFKLNPANYKLKYLDEDGDWILMTSDKDVRSNEQMKQYCHLLNSTLTATERTMCCILENYQREDGVEILLCPSKPHLQPKKQQKGRNLKHSSR
ncbi:hypothetical protein OSB04_010431 [Centaurea solstitialis]|uniref:PB1 domain-containing protein n=1 Tax=Centaurea solstitialis TaxID=347529 RepID=A0AA38WBY4_9ASTR|nr:hypothetical protein OSB04_010431 [Centaurea solstitialis]